MITQQQSMDQIQTTNQIIGQQPQIVATVQLPNGLIGQLIAPSGGQFWSPNAVNLQQLSMAVAAATGTMPQTLSLPISSQVSTSSTPTPTTTTTNGSHQSGMITMSQQMHSTQHQHQSQPNQQQQPQQQATQLGNSNSCNNGGALGQNTQITTANQQVSTHNNNGSSSSNNSVNQQMAPTMGSRINDNHNSAQLHPQNQFWSGGPISLSQLSALAQQGVIQLSPVQGLQSSCLASGQELVQGLLSHQLGSSGGCDQMVAPDPQDDKWQFVGGTQPSGPNQNSSPSILNSSMGSGCVSHSTGNVTHNMNQSDNSFGNALANNASMVHYDSNITSDSNNDNITTSLSHSQNNHTNICNNNSNSNDHSSAQTQKKLKRLACTCPNCRDGDNTRSNSGAGVDKKKQHICHFPDCNKVYGKTSHLRAHLRWHSGK